MNDSLSGIVEGMSAHARFTIKGGNDHEWYARTERAADELVALNLCRQPFRHDRRILVPNVQGIAIQQHMEKES